METLPLKFLLKLLDCPNYRASLARSFRGFKRKYEICQQLGKDGLVDYTREIATVKIAPPGRTLLTSDSSNLPISDSERRVLHKIAKSNGIPPGKITIQIGDLPLKAARRDAILQQFQQQGLIAVETQLQRKNAEVWLTPRGRECLQQLHSYFHSWRKSARSAILKDIYPRERFSTSNQPDDAEILYTIQELDKELGTENYLPIFHLRQKLQPPLSRTQLDRALYRLERNNQIELSTLQEVRFYTPNQIDAGIPQEIGGPLFFIMMN